MYKTFAFTFVIINNLFLSMVYLYVSSQEEVLVLLHLVSCIYEKEMISTSLRHYATLRYLYLALLLLVSYYHAIILSSTVQYSTEQCGLYLYMSSCHRRPDLSDRIS